MAWGELGDYEPFAAQLEPVALELLAALPVGPGVDLLDVASGTGNLAVPAAAAGARVTGLDLAPRLLELARARAGAAGVEVAWVEGDAEALPFADASFDLVTSVMGVIFALRDEVTVAELARVCRPGGTIAVTAWTATGQVGRGMAIVAAATPPSPSYVRPTYMWGDADYVRGLFAPHAVELSFERRTVPLHAASPEAYIAALERDSGAFIAVVELLGDAWPPVRDALVENATAFSRPAGGGVAIDSEYLVTVGRPSSPAARRARSRSR